MSHIIHGAKAIRIVVDGVPVAKERARVRVVKSGDRSFASAYTPSKTRKYEDVLRLAAGNSMADLAPLDGPLKVRIIALLPIPKSLSKAKQAQAIAGTIRPVSRPDVDNYAKSALDGLNTIVWRDDAQVVDLMVSKFYSDKPGLVIEVSQIGGGQP
jgi:Holliday junction resolvase RusA-like endonuclease